MKGRVGSFTTFPGKQALELVTSWRLSHRGQGALTLQDGEGLEPGFLGPGAEAQFCAHPAQRRQMNWTGW